MLTGPTGCDRHLAILRPNIQICGPTFGERGQKLRSTVTSAQLVDRTRLALLSKGISAAHRYDGTAQVRRALAGPAPGALDLSAAQDLAVKTIEPGLALANQLRLKLPARSRGTEISISPSTVNQYAIATVAAAAISRIALLVTQILRHVGSECPLNLRSGPRASWSSLAVDQSS